MCNNPATRICLFSVPALLSCKHPPITCHLYVFKSSFFRGHIWDKRLSRAFILFSLLLHQQSSWTPTSVDDFCSSLLLWACRTVSGLGGSWCKHFCPDKQTAGPSSPALTPPLRCSSGSHGAELQLSHRGPSSGFIYAQTRSALKMIQHTGRQRGAVCVCVFTSGTWILQVRGSGGGHILRVGARQQRRPLVHAVGGHVVHCDEWREAPESSRGT